MHDGNTNVLIVPKNLYGSYQLPIYQLVQGRRQLTRHGNFISTNVFFIFENWNPGRIFL